MATLDRITVLIALLFLAGTASADAQRAHINYLIHCQGCHLPHAVGVAGTVPRMNEFVGYFLHSLEGREFLIRVPGVATSSLPDEEIAELMNWLIQTYSPEEMPDEFEPYTETEVAALRLDPDEDPASSRQKILARIAANLPALAKDLETSKN